MLQAFCVIRIFCAANKKIDKQYCKLMRRLKNYRLWTYIFCALFRDVFEFTRDNNNFFCRNVKIAFIPTFLFILKDEKKFFFVVFVGIKVSMWIVNYRDQMGEELLGENLWKTRELCVINHDWLIFCVSCNYLLWRLKYDSSFWLVCNVIFINSYTLLYYY